MPLGVLQPPHDLLIEPAGDVGRRRATAQQMLGAEDLGCLAEDDPSAGGDEHVGCHTQRRVGGDRGRGVAAAALEPERQLAEGHRLALEPIEPGGHPITRSTSAATVAFVPPSS